MEGMPARQKKLNARRSQVHNKVGDRRDQLPGGGKMQNRESRRKKNKGVATKEFSSGVRYRRRQGQQ